MSFWNPDKECDRPFTSEYYDQQAELGRIKADFRKLQNVCTAQAKEIERLSADRIKLTKNE